MKKNIVFHMVYAAALIVAAASGSGLAFAERAFAQGNPAGSTGTNAVSLSSTAVIERVEKDKSGKERTVFKTPKEVVVVPGDHVVFTLSYSNSGAEPASGFRATNPMPAPVQFVAANEDWAEVSVDGGATWGKLVDLAVSTQADGATGSRPAKSEDVTHVRWVFAEAIAPGKKGSVSYRGLIK